MSSSRLALVVLLRRIPRPRLVLAAATLFAIYLFLGFSVLPRYLHGAIPEIVSQQLKRRATVGDVSFNPFLLKLELSDVALTEVDTRPIAGFRRLVVDFQLSSLWRWAWTFSEISFDGLEVRADIAEDGRFNFAALVEDLPKGEASSDPNAPPPRVLLQHFALTDASFTFSDRTGTTPKFATLRPLAIDLRDLSTLPDRKGPYNVTARLPGGGRVAWRGEMALRPIFSLGEFSLEGHRPAALWRFLEERFKLSEPEGVVAANLRYRFAYADGVTELSVEDMRVTVSDIELAAYNAREPFFKLKTAAVTGGRFDLGRRELSLPSVELRGGFLRAEIDADGKLDLQNLVVAGTDTAKEAPAPSSSSPPWRVKLDAIRVGDLALRLRDWTRVSPLVLGVGAVEAGLSVSLETGGDGPQVQVGGLAVTLSGVSAGVATASAPLASIDTVSLEGGSFDLRGQRIAARRIGIKGGTVELAREADGALRVLELAQSKVASSRQPASAPKTAKPWQLALDAFDVEGVKISLADHGFGSQPVTYDIEPTIALKHLQTGSKAPARLEAALRVAQGGTLRVNGEMSQPGDRARVRARLERLSLKPLQPALASLSTLVLESADVSTTLEAQYRRTRERDELRLTGEASLDDLRINEAGSGERLLEWKSVAAKGISFGLGPDRLAIADVVLRGLGTKIHISKEGKLNLAEAFKPAAPATAPAPVPPPASQPAPTPAKESGPVLPISIERVRLEPAAVDFSDQSLVLPFAARIREFQGDMQALSSDRASRAVVKLEGRVDEFGLARVDGSVAPFDPTGFLDLRVIFRNVEMSPLSPYSATFTGRRIAAGRLGLDLQYRIEKGALAGDNKVELQNFTLGERVEAPGATNLPLDLAVAILTDGQGRIALAVPVKGDVNDPQFSYGHLVWQALVTVISNIATAPFRALFGGGGENLDSIAFDAGRAALLPPEREKLKRVAGALGQRPQLKLVVGGQYSETDSVALRRREVAGAIAVRLDRSAGTEPPPVNTRDARTQRALEMLFAERASEDALDAFAVEQAQARGKPVQRVGAMAVFGAGTSADGAFYDALLNRLTEASPLPGDALEKLAAGRTTAVAEHLEKVLSVPPERIGRAAPAAGDGERAKLSLDVASQPAK